MRRPARVGARAPRTPLLHAVLGQADAVAVRVLVVLGKYYTTSIIQLVKVNRMILLGATMLQNHAHTYTYNIRII